MLSLLGAFLSLAFVAVGVLIGATRRRRAVGIGTRQMVVDLRSATPVVSPSAAAGAVLGDPTAVVRYQRADGRWIGSAGGVLDAIAADRRLLPVVDETSNVVAGLEVDAATPVPPLLADLAVSTIAAQSANERAAALADARRMEVRGRSRELVAAADAGRIVLERNLHDGAQQLLVGLALTAGLQARQERKLLENSTDTPVTGSGGIDHSHQPGPRRHPGAHRFRHPCRAVRRSGRCAALARGDQPDQCVLHPGRRSSGRRPPGHKPVPRS